MSVPLRSIQTLQNLFYSRMFPVKIQCCCFVQFIRVYWRWLPGKIRVVIPSQFRHFLLWAFLPSHTTASTSHDLRSTTFFLFSLNERCFSVKTVLSPLNSLLILGVVQFFLLVSHFRPYECLFITVFRSCLRCLCLSHFVRFSDDFLLRSYSFVWIIIRVYFKLSSFTFQFLLNLF
jgi:hypothetical protein